MSAFDFTTLVQILIFGLTNGATIALAAIGISLLFGMVRILNLAYGDVFALATVLSSVIILNLHLQPDSPPALLYGGLTLSMLGGCAMGVGLNVLLERAAFRPFRNTSRLAPLIATLGISFILYQVSLLWRVTLPSYIQGEHRSVPGLPEVPLDAVPDLLPSGNFFERFGPEPALVLDTRNLALWCVAIATALAVSIFLRRARFGRAMRAVSQNPDLAQLCGINVQRTITGTFALGGLLAGFAAFVFVLHYGRPFGQHGAQSGLIAFSAAILGGVGSPIGALLSAFAIGIIQSLSDFYLATTWTPLLVYSLLIILLVLRPGPAVADEAQEIRDTVTVLYRASKSRWVRWVWLALLAAVALYPLAEPALGFSRQSTLTVVMIFVMLAVGLTVMLGFAGMLDLGYAISFGIGGYITAMLTDPYGKLHTLLGLGAHVEFLIVLAIAGLAAGLFGVLNAVLTFRMRADYLAVVTLAYGLIIRQLLVIFPEFTGGNQGLSVIPEPYLFGVIFESPTARYYLALLLCVLVVLGAQRLAQSRAGRAFMAMGEDALAAASAGVNVNHYKGMAFVIGTAIAGLAGALYASSIGYVDPEMAEFRVSLMVLAMVIVSGAGSVPGAVIGAIVIALYDRLAIPLLGDILVKQSGGLFDIRQLSYLTFGLAVYLTVLLRARQRGGGRGGLGGQRAAGVDRPAV